MGGGRGEERGIRGRSAAPILASAIVRAVALPAMVVGMLAMLSLPPEVSAQSAECELVIGTERLSQAGDLDHAIHLDAGSSIDVLAVASGPGRAMVWLGYGPLAWPVVDETLEPAEGGTWTWRGTVDVARYSTFGVGVYQVRASAGACSLTGWVTVVGRAPYTTPLGILALVAILIGLATALLAVIRSPGRRAGLVRAAIGGAIAGVGLLLFAQQAGLSQARPDSIVLWVVLPASIGAGVHALAGLVAGSRFETAGAVVPSAPSSAPLPSPSPVPSSAPPPSPSSPPVPSAAPVPSSPPLDSPAPPAPHVPSASPVPSSPPPASPAPSTPAATVPPAAGPPLAPDALPAPSPATSVPPASAPGPAPAPAAAPGAPPPSPVASPPPPASAPAAAPPAPAPASAPATALPPPTTAPATALPPQGPSSAPAASTQAPAAPHPGAGSPAGPVAPATREPDPPRSSFARVECPDAVVADQPFELVVGLAPTPDPQVVGPALRRPASSVGPYTLTIQVLADGFRLLPDESWRVDLPVTASAPYPSATLHLAADATAQPVRAGSIRVMYSVAGHPIGLAIRPVAIVRTAALLEETPAQPAQPAVDLALPAAAQPPDLTVRIERAESESSGRLLLQLLAADTSIPVPAAPMRVDIGGDPAADLRRVVDEMNAVEGTPTQYVSLRGIGLAIADQLPDAFWDTLRLIAARVDGRRPMVLFLSAEPYVPWELAVVDPPIDPELPPFLAAQANVGRWVLGQRRPKLPPPATLDIASLAVVSGVYDLPGWERLLEAEAEATDLVDRYGADAVNATAADVLALLRRSPGADLVHFACHGTFDGGDARDGLVLVDGTALDPLAVRGVALSGTPFVFLNACQVGRGDQLLGDPAGMAEAFLYAGAAGVIAPLWSIDDRLAHQIALRFYERALRGEPAGEILRSERAAFRDSPETVSSTYLAYQYFGHPALRLARRGAASTPGGDAGPGGLEQPTASPDRA